MASKLCNVFVYGTLKKGEPNHNWFTKDKNGLHNFLGEAETIERYPLIIGTKYNIPFLLQKPGKGNNVLGELYEIDENVLANLDILEDHPNFYVREELEVKSLVDQKNIKAWIYFIKKFKPELLEQTLYQSYSNFGDHGLKYVTSEDSSLEDLNWMDEMLN